MVQIAHGGVYFELRLSLLFFPQAFVVRTSFSIFIALSQASEGIGYSAISASASTERTLSPPYLTNHQQHGDSFAPLNKDAHLHVVEAAAANCAALPLLVAPGSLS